MTQTTTSEIQPSEIPPGYWVLFNIGTYGAAESPVLRPMLVMSGPEGDDEAVAGQVFFSPDDRHSTWILEQGHFIPTVQALSCWVPYAKRGRGIGQWRPRHEWEQGPPATPEGK